MYSVHSGQAYYINSKLGMKEPVLLLQNRNYGLCNTDIDTIWEKTRHGLDLYGKIVDYKKLSSSVDLLPELETLMRDNKSFSEDPNNEASIFVSPYYCTSEKTERRTKSTTFILVRSDLSLQVREITHHNSTVVDYQGTF